MTMLEPIITWIQKRLTDPDFYKGLVYLALSFPLGLAYFIALVVGFSLGGGLLVIGVGLAIWALTIGLARLAGNFEASLARNLLNADIAKGNDGMLVNSGSVVSSAKDTLLDTKTWRSLIFAALKFPFGLATFISMVVTTAITGAFLTAPLFYQSANISIGNQLIDTLPEAIAASAVGVVMIPVTLLVMTLFMTGWRALAEYSLQPSNRQAKQKRKNTVQQVNNRTAYDIASRIEDELHRRTRYSNPDSDGELIYESDYRTEKARGLLTG
ncbi:MAG: sensor domain-containing protein [Chloroflexota bacterium]